MEAGSPTEGQKGIYATVTRDAVAQIYPGYFVSFGTFCTASRLNFVAGTI